MSAAMSQVAVNGQRLWCEDSGGTKPAILFAHDFMMDGSMFDPYVAALRSRYRTVVWDSRGSGQTKSDGDEFSLWDLAEDAASLMSSLGIDKAIIAGAGLGGFTALRLALRHPERVAGLMLLATDASAPDPEHTAELEGMCDAWQTYGASDELAYNLANLLIADPPAALGWIQKWQDHSKDWMVEPSRCLLGREDISEQVPRIQCPAMLIHGLHDATVSLESAQELRVLLPGFQQMSIVEHAGHGVAVSHQDECLRAMKEFLADI
jgi:3-oxoadipate enol-lactonase